MKIIDKLLWILYPVVAFYLRFIRVRINKLSGYYISSRIVNKGKDLKIHGIIDIHDIHKLVIGDYCRIGKGCFLFCLGGIEIGNNVQMSRNITIYSANHDYNADIVPYSNQFISKKVKINDSAWIGMNVCILPGVIIGKGAIVGMGSIITKDVPDFAIVVGNDRVVGYRKNMELDFSDDKLFYGKTYPNS
jgi:acetyltransferase-like isoleucine patch superfamily enzyme